MDYRHGLVTAQFEIDLPLQIRALRKQRGWSQATLADKAGMKQPRITLMERPGGASFTIETLRRIARAFDVALLVRFAPFSEFLNDSNGFNPESFNVLDFETEVAVEATMQRHGNSLGLPTAASELLADSIDHWTQPKYRRATIVFSDTPLCNLAKSENEERQDKPQQKGLTRELFTPHIPQSSQDNSCLSTR